MMRNNYLLILVVLLVMAFGVGRLSAAPGTLDSPAPPGSTSSYTLEDIYNRLNDGTAGTPSTFTEPSAGPGTGTMHTLNDIMAAANDADLVAGNVRSGVTIFGVTGTCYRLPLTGQTRCWNTSGDEIPCTGTGQDGAYKLGCLPEVGPCSGDDGCNFNRTDLPWASSAGHGFVDNGDGTVTDTLTGLIWLKNANCWGDHQNWATALTLANGLASGSCGLSDGSSAGDWRLPNINELRSLIDPDRTDPALPLNHPFTGVQLDLYASSSSVEADSFRRAWLPRLIDGFVTVGDKAIPDKYVWPVRGGQ